MEFFCPSRWNVCSRGFWLKRAPFFFFFCIMFISVYLYRWAKAPSNLLNLWKSFFQPNEVTLSQLQRNSDKKRNFALPVSQQSQSSWVFIDRISMSKRLKKIVSLWIFFCVLDSLCRLVCGSCALCIQHAAFHSLRKTTTTSVNKNESSSRLKRN